MDNSSINGRKKSTSAPSSKALRPQQDADDDETNGHRKTIFRSATSTGSHKYDKKKKHSKMPSSSSLHSLVSILKQDESTQIQQQSVPNVSFVDENFPQEKLKASKSSVNLSCENSTSHLQYTMDIGDNIKSVHNGSISTPSSTVGFRASFFSILEKIGIWRSQDLYKTTSASASEIKCFTSERRAARNSVSSLLFRTFHGSN